MNKGIIFFKNDLFRELSLLWQILCDRPLSVFSKKGNVPDFLFARLSDNDNFVVVAYETINYNWDTNSLKKTRKGASKKNTV